MSQLYENLTNKPSSTEFAAAVEAAITRNRLRNKTKSAINGFFAHHAGIHGQTATAAALKSLSQDPVLLTWAADGINETEVAAIERRLVADKVVPQLARRLAVDLAFAVELAQEV